MDFTVFNKDEIEEMFQAMYENMPGNIRQIAVEEFGGVTHWKEHYMEVMASEDMQKRYAKVVEWYGGKDDFLDTVNNPISKEVAESYKKRVEAILEKLNSKRNYPLDAFEVKETIGEFGFVMRMLCQIKEEKGLMLAQAQMYRNEKIRPTIDQKYGEGAAEFFAQAIEEFYK